ncbi:His Kinase A (phospho-acceptor) domain-containing protein [Granulicella rosea]|uniref:histidine kinase n=1 Tax=Granulicella rosea TaxID=474952 RepID=A0A239J521_9BACT|nr:ATP-binding protein [Granulicella rosea]SNT00947.1 His Kinase A (phospho-acceptor) domain-containing protein [Granulicella rosea]
MRLKTKLVMAASGVTFAIVLVLSVLFLGEMLRQRIDQTGSSNDVLAREVLLMTRQAVESGLRAHPPADHTDEAFHAAVADALRASSSLNDVMTAIVRYSPAVQDVGVTDSHGYTLVSTDPQMWNQVAMARTEFEMVRRAGFGYQAREIFGAPHVLDVTVPLDRNGEPFLVVHVGVRSTFLLANIEPWLRAAGFFALVAGLVSVLAAGLLANVALRPIEQISRRLEELTVAGEAEPLALPEPRSRVLGLPTGRRSDAVVRVKDTIDRLGRQLRSTEEGYTALQANMNRVLDTLRDGVLLITAAGRAVMVSDAVAHFLVDSRPEGPMVGLRLDEIFRPETGLGRAVLAAFESGRRVPARTVVLEDGREVELSLDPIDDGRGDPGSLGTLLTLRDTETALEIERELEVSRRLAAIGRLTAGVGHEVKNPINAMVVHLELLKSKLAAGTDIAGAQRHAEVLAGEMQRLDRVVQTLADFSRPMELHLRETDLREIVGAVVSLTSHELEENHVHVEVEEPDEPLMVLVDAEMIRQAVLNLVLNAMQAMPEGGQLRLNLRREHHFCVLEVVDQGEGIPPDLLPRIFELYFTTKAKGSGIGLAMTYRILQMHGGAMEVRSSVVADAADRGATFTLRLPLNPAGARGLDLKSER